MEKRGVDRNLLHYVSSILGGFKVILLSSLLFFSKYYVVFGRWCT